MSNNYLNPIGTVFSSPGGEGEIPIAPGSTGQFLQQQLSSPGGVGWASAAVGPGTAVNANDLAAFSDTTGDALKDSGISAANGNITFPAGKGVILTAGATGSERKGTFTFNGSGTHTQIATTAAVTGCVIVYTVASLGTVTSAQAILSTIANGVGFTPVSADGTDSSVVNWCIVG